MCIYLWFVSKTSHVWLQWFVSYHYLTKTEIDILHSLYIVLLHFQEKNLKENCIFSALLPRKISCPMWAMLVFFQNQKFTWLTLWYIGARKLKKHTDLLNTEGGWLWQVTEATVNFMFSEAMCGMPCGGIMSLPRCVKISHFIEMFKCIWGGDMKGGMMIPWSFLIK